MGMGTSAQLPKSPGIPLEIFHFLPESQVLKTSNEKHIVLLIRSFTQEGRQYGLNVNLLSPIGSFT